MPPLSPRPHWRHWEELAALVQDGIAFSRTGGRGVKSGYSEVSQSAGRKTNNHGGSPRQDKKQKTEQRHSSHSKSRHEQKQKSVVGVADTLAQEDFGNETATANGPVGSTASGGGGRWVHVST